MDRGTGGLNQSWGSETVDHAGDAGWGFERSRLGEKDGRIVARRRFIGRWMLGT